MLVIIVGDPYVRSVRHSRIYSINRLRAIIGYDSSLLETIYYSGTFRPDMMNLAMDTHKLNKNFVVDAECLSDVPQPLIDLADVVVMTDEPSAKQTLELYGIGVEPNFVNFTFNNGSTRPFVMIDRRISPNSVGSFSN